MSHLKRNLILEQKSPLNSEAYSVLNCRKPLFSQRNTALYAINEHCIIGTPHLPEVEIYR